MKRGKYRRVRKNPDFFTDSTGVHPIRESRGYIEWLTDSPKSHKTREGFSQKLREKARQRYSR